MNKETQRVPILLMTGYTVSRTNPLIKLADDIIEKPFHLNLLEPSHSCFSFIPSQLFIVLYTIFADTAKGDNNLDLILNANEQI